MFSNTAKKAIATGGGLIALYLIVVHGQNATGETNSLFTGVRGLVTGLQGR